MTKNNYLKKTVKTICAVAIAGATICAVDYYDVTARYSSKYLNRSITQDRADRLTDEMRNILNRFPDLNGNEYLINYATSAMKADPIKYEKSILAIEKEYLTKGGFNALAKDLAIHKDVFVDSAGKLSNNIYDSITEYVNQKVKK